MCHVYIYIYTYVYMYVYTYMCLWVYAYILTYKHTKLFTTMRESWHTYESCHTYERVMSHMWRDPCHIYGCIMSQTWGPDPSPPLLSSLCSSCAFSLSPPHSLWHSLSLAFNGHQSLYSPTSVFDMCVCVCVCVGVCVTLCACVYVCAWVYVCASACACDWPLIALFANLYLLPVYVCVCMCVCVYVCSGPWITLFADLHTRGVSCLMIM
jgi:hypothetical protein